MYENGGRIVNRPFIISLDDTLSRLACLVSLAGALCIRLLGWELGWALIAFGVISLWLAHQFAVAPLCQDPVPSRVSQLGRMHAADRVGQD